MFVEFVEGLETEFHCAQSDGGVALSLGRMKLTERHGVDDIETAPSTRSHLHLVHHDLSFDRPRRHRLINVPEALGAAS